MGLQHEVRGAHVVLAAVFKELDLQRRTCEARWKTGVGDVAYVRERRRATYRLLHSSWPALVQHRPTLGVVDLEPQGETDGSDVIRRVLQRPNISIQTAPRIQTFSPATARTHVNMEGKFVADGSARVDPDHQLGLPVGAVVEQSPRRQLPVVQRGGNPEV